MIDIDDLLNRLMCKYPIGPILENGMPEFGFRDFSGRMEVDLPTTPMIEAAETIKSLRARLQSAESKLADMENNKPVGYIHEIDLEHLQETGKGKIYRDSILDSIAVYADPAPPQSHIPEDKKVDIRFIEDCLMSYRSSVYEHKGLRDKIQEQLDILSNSVNQ